MKRKLAGFVIVLLLFCMMLPSAAGTGTMYSMSVNDKLLEYSADTMPTVYEGQVYVPYTMFVSRQNGGVELGIFHSWNKKLNILSLYSREEPFLTFDIETGTAYDVQDNIYPYKAIVRNGTVFLPAQKVCSYFGLQYSSVSHAYGTLVRVKKDGAFFLSDNFLISAAESRLKEQKEIYDKEQAAILPTPGPAAPEVQRPSRIQVCFAFRCDSGENVGRILDELKDYGVGAAFYFEPEDLAKQDDLIRRLLAEGHKIGLWVTGEDAQACEAGAEEGNRLLKHIARTRTDFLLVEDEQLQAELEELDWLCWDGNVDGSPEGNVTSATLAANIYRSVDSKQELACVMMDNSEISAAALERVLSRLTGDRYTFRVLTETFA